MRLSVVIPTRNRLASLRRVVDALGSQVTDVAGGAQIVVVNDGSTDGTSAYLASGAPGLVAVEQQQGGPARARNAGVAAAAGEVVVFLGDDIEPEPGFLAAHEAAHRRSAEPVAVLGYTSWDSRRMRVTPLLVYLNEKGPQFGYSLIPDALDVPFRFFYTSNVSLPRSVFLDLGGFDTAFPDAAFEDIELAYRATRPPARLRIVFEPGARALHDHPTTLQEFRARLRARGRSAARFAGRHPELAEWLGVPDARSASAERPATVGGLEILVRAAEVLGFSLPDGVYHRVLRWDYLAGVKDGLRLTEETFDTDAEGNHLAS